MRPPELQELLEKVARGETSPAAAAQGLRDFPFQTLAGMRLDTSREIRTGIPEVVLAGGKSRAEILRAAVRIHADSGRVLVTRLAPEDAEELAGEIPNGTYDARSRTFLAAPALAAAPPAAVAPPALAAPLVALISAGTSDGAVLGEAEATLRFLGRASLRVEDAGVAGIHRLLEAREEISSASVRIVFAGMEGALASVVCGLFGGPVIGVPTSVGYGTALGGLTALFSMLTSCAAGLAVVGIDNGFGAAVLADRILAARPAR